jgi:hypothetical protein
LERLTGDDLTPLRQYDTRQILYEKGIGDWGLGIGLWDWIETPATAVAGLKLLLVLLWFFLKSNAEAVAQPLICQRVARIGPIKTALGDLEHC